MKTLAMTAIVFMTISLSSCASSGSTTQGSSEPTPAFDTEATVTDYFEGWSNGDPTAMVKASSPGSPAREYAEYRGLLDRMGGTSALPEVTTTAQEAVLTYSVDDTTVTNSNFMFDDGGLLLTWTSKPGGPLARRIVTKPKKARLGSVKIQYLQQYRDPDGALWVTLKAVNKANQLARVVPNGYVSPSGRQSTATIGTADSSGVLDVLPKATVLGYVKAERGDPGGRLSIYTFNDSGMTTAEDVVQLPK